MASTWGIRKYWPKCWKKGAELGLPTVVIIFEPQPREFFAAGQQAAPRLTRFDEKVRLLRTQGVDRVLCLTFNERLRAMTADQFVHELLLQGLAVKHFVVGDDFRFGCDRSGDYNMLCQSGERYDFSVVNTATYDVEGERVSSSRIRQVAAHRECRIWQVQSRFIIGHCRIASGSLIGFVCGIQEILPNRLNISKDLLFKLLQPVELLLRTDKSFKFYGQ